VLDVLRQPLESRSISIHRASAIASFPASFQLVLAANPCPCGQWSPKGESCTCAPSVKRRYLSRISGPLRDRLDLELWVPRLTTTASAGAGGRVSSDEARRRVELARAVAAERYRGTPWRTNAEVPGPWLRGTGGMHPGQRATVAIDRALESGGLTMRGYDKVLRLAWTLADLDGAGVPDGDHVGQANVLRRAPLWAA
jgi:magnesium chelatase family protein